MGDYLRYNEFVMQCCIWMKEIRRIGDSFLNGSFRNMDSIHSFYTACYLMTKTENIAFNTINIFCYILIDCMICITKKTPTLVLAFIVHLRIALMSCTDLGKENKLSCHNPQLKPYKSIIFVTWIYKCKVICEFYFSSNKSFPSGSSSFKTRIISLMKGNIVYPYKIE